MTEENWYTDLAEYLETKGHTANEIEKIVARVREYDLDMKHDSVMDSIANGGFDLASIIDEALKD